MNDKLSEHADAAAQRAAAATASLREQTSALADVDGFDPTTDLTAADALHPSSRPPHRRVWRPRTSGTSNRPHRT
ncbi:hypothetical protein ACFQ0Q_50660 [Streptomyces aureus]